MSSDNTKFSFIITFKCSHLPQPKQKSHKTIGPACEYSVFNCCAQLELAGEKYRHDCLLKQKGLDFFYIFAV